LQRDLAKTGGKSSPDEYLRPFFEKSTKQEYAGLSILAYKELMQIPGQFRHYVYRLAQKKARLEGRIIIANDITKSAKQYIMEQF
jgi:hypothetical protein